MATLDELQRAGAQLLRTPNGRVHLYSPNSTGGDVLNTITDPQNFQGVPIRDITDQQASSIFGGRGSGNISSGTASTILNNAYRNIQNPIEMAKQVSDAEAMNQFIAQNPNSPSLPTTIDPTGQYAVVGGKLVQKSAISSQQANEAAVAAGTMKKVPIGSGFGYIPVGSVGAALNQLQETQANLQKPDLGNPQVAQWQRELARLEAAKASGSTDPNYGISGIPVDKQIANLKRNIAERKLDLEREVQTLGNQIPGRAPNAGEMTGQFTPPPLK